MREVGKFLAAFSMTCLSDVATLSCCVCRLLEPVWMMIWLGEPSWASVSSSRALSVVGHHNFSTRRCGNNFPSSMNFPLESISMTMSGLGGAAEESGCVGGGEVGGAGGQGGEVGGNVGANEKVGGAGGVVGVLGGVRGAK